MYRPHEGASVIDAGSALFGAFISAVVTAVVLGRDRVLEILYAHVLRRMRTDSLRQRRAAD